MLSFEHGKSFIPSGQEVVKCTRYVFKYLGWVWYGDNGIDLSALIWSQGYKTFFMFNSAEHEICPANKSKITNDCKFFFA